MALIGNDFVEVVVRKTGILCSECRKKLSVGVTCLESWRKGKLRKRVCGERCRLIFDDRFWQGSANQHKH